MIDVMPINPLDKETRKLLTSLKAFPGSSDLTAVCFSSFISRR